MNQFPSPMSVVPYCCISKFFFILWIFYYPNKILFSKLKRWKKLKALKYCAPNHHQNVIVCAVAHISWKCHQEPSINILSYFANWQTHISKNVSSLADVIMETDSALGHILERDQDHDWAKNQLKFSTVVNLSWFLAQLELYPFCGYQPWGSINFRHWILVKKILKYFFESQCGSTSFLPKHLTTGRPPT